MAYAVYLLCAVTSFICFALLLRGYRVSRVRLLMWSSLCFLGFGLNNVFLFLDVIVFPEVDLSIYRELPALAGVMLLLFGLIWETRR